MTITAEETTDRCDIAKIKEGSVWTRHDSGKVIGIRGNKIDVKNDKGDTWELTDLLVASQFSFADQSDQELKITRTEMIAVLKDNIQTAMTVVYKKKADVGVVASELAIGQNGQSDRAWKSKVKTLIEGVERVMVGHHYGTMDAHDRLQFREHGKGPRLVDTRTLQSVLVNRTQYVIK